MLVQDNPAYVAKFCTDEPHWDHGASVEQMQRAGPRADHFGSDLPNIAHQVRYIFRLQSVLPSYREATGIGNRAQMLVLLPEGFNADGNVLAREQINHEHGGLPPGLPTDFPEPAPVPASATEDHVPPSPEHGDRKEDTDHDADGIEGIVDESLKPSNLAPEFQVG
jgi:hypothetical protein